MVALSPLQRFVFKLWKVVAFRPKKMWATGITTGC